MDTGDEQMKQSVRGEYKGFYKAMPAPGAIVLLALFLVPLFFTLSKAFLVEEGFSLLASNRPLPQPIRFAFSSLLSTRLH